MAEIKIYCSYSELVPLEKLVPNPRNDNKHGEEHAKLLAKVMKARGVRHPIIVSKRSGFIAAGHLRLMAARINGYESYPIDYQDFENEADEYAFLSSDNNVARYAEFDKEKFIDNLKDLNVNFENFDHEEYGFLDFELPQIEVLAPQCDEDEVPEVKEDPITKRGDIWLLGKHRLMCGDSTMIDDVEKLMNGEKADMVFTDPPYGIGFAYNSHKDSTGDEYRDFCRDWFHNLKQFSDFLVISTGWAYNAFWYDYEPTDCFYWLSKNKRTGGKISHFRKIEPIFIWGKPKNKYNFDFWEQTSEIEKELKGQHTCPKPVSLICSILEGGNEKDYVLDFFTGSGTTVIACEKTNRKCFGMELDEHYCDVIINRYMRFTGKDDVILESTGEKYNDLKGSK